MIIIDKKLQTGTSSLILDRAGRGGSYQIPKKYSTFSVLQNVNSSFKFLGKFKLKKKEEDFHKPSHLGVKLAP